MIGFGIHTKLLRLIKFPIENGLKDGDSLTSLPLNFALEYAIRKVKVNHKLLQFMRSLFMVMMLIYGVKPYTPYAVSVRCKETGLEVNVEKAENMFLSHEQQEAQKHNT